MDKAADIKKNWDKGSEQLSKELDADNTFRNRSWMEDLSGCFGEDSNVDAGPPKESEEETDLSSSESSSDNDDQNRGVGNSENLPVEEESLGHDLGQLVQIQNENIQQIQEELDGDVNVQFVAQIETQTQNAMQREPTLDHSQNIVIINENHQPGN